MADAFSAFVLASTFVLVGTHRHDSGELFDGSNLRLGGSPVPDRCGSRFRIGFTDVVEEIAVYDPEDYYTGTHNTYIHIVLNTVVFAGSCTSVRSGTPRQRSHRTV